MFQINTCFDDQTVLLEYLRNDYKCAFVLDDVRYFSVEQYLLYQYALIMGDEKACQEILETKTPKKLSKIDVKTKEERCYLWAVQRQEFLLKATLAKFKKDIHLFSMLCGVRGEIVYISKDNFMGIGMEIKDNVVPPKKEWLGENMLGYTLMYVRKKLQEERKALAEAVTKEQ